jgi:hypothetical protein
LKIGLIDRAEDAVERLNKIVPDHPPYQLMLADTYLRTPGSGGERKECSGRLKFIHRDGTEEFFPRTNNEAMVQLIN